MPFISGVQDLVLKINEKYKVRWEGGGEYTLVTFKLVTETGYNFVDEKGNHFLPKHVYDSGYLKNKPGHIKVYISNKLTMRPHDFIPKVW